MLTFSKLVVCLPKTTYKIKHDTFAHLQKVITHPKHSTRVSKETYINSQSPKVKCSLGIVLTVVVKKFRWFVIMALDPSNVPYFTSVLTLNVHCTTKSILSSKLDAIVYEIENYSNEIPKVQGLTLLQISMEISST